MLRIISGLSLIVLFSVLGLVCAIFFLDWGVDEWTDKTSQRRVTPFSIENIAVKDGGVVTSGHTFNNKGEGNINWYFWAAGGIALAGVILGCVAGLPRMLASSPAAPKQPSLPVQPPTIKARLPKLRPVESPSAPQPQPVAEPVKPEPKLEPQPVPQPEPVAEAPKIVAEPPKPVEPPPLIVTAPPPVSAPPPPEPVAQPEPQPAPVLAAKPEPKLEPAPVAEPVAPVPPPQPPAPVIEKVPEPQPAPAPVPAPVSAPVPVAPPADRGLVPTFSRQVAPLAVSGLLSENDLILNQEIIMNEQNSMLIPKPNTAQLRQKNSTANPFARSIDPNLRLLLKRAMLQLIDNHDSSVEADVLDGKLNLDSYKEYLEVFARELSKAMNSKEGVAYLFESCGFDVTPDDINLYPEMRWQKELTDSGADEGVPT